MKQEESAARIVEESEHVTARMFRGIYVLFLGVMAGLLFTALYFHGWALLLLLPAAYMALAAGVAGFAARIAKEIGR